MPVTLAALALCGLDPAALFHVPVSRGEVRVTGRLARGMAPALAA